FWKRAPTSTPTTATARPHWCTPARPGMGKPCNSLSSPQQGAMANEFPGRTSDAVNEEASAAASFRHGLLQNTAHLSRQCLGRIWLAQQLHIRLEPIGRRKGVLRIGGG